MPLCVAGLVRATSLFPILSTILLLLGGLCVGLGQIYSSRNNILLSAGILFVWAGTVFAINSNLNIQEESLTANHKFSNYSISMYF